MDIKDEIILGIKGELFSKTSLTPNQIDIVDGIIRIALSTCDIIPQERALTTFDYSDSEMIQKFFLAKAVEGLSKNSCRTYSSIYKKFFKDVRKKIKDVTTEDVRVYLAIQKVGGASTNYQNIIKRSLSSLYQWLLEENFVDINPIAKIKTIKNTKVVRLPLTDYELEELRAACKSRRDLALFDFMYSSGCRVSEICNLDITDIDLDKREALVLGKGDKERVVYLSARAIVSMKDYLQHRNDDCPALFVSTPENMIGYWSMPEEARKKPERLKKSGVEIICRKLGERCGIEKVHPHRFRRTVATNSLRRGMPLEQVSKLLGHANINVTTIYAQSEQDEVKSQHGRFII